MKEIKGLHEKALQAASNYRKAEWQMIDVLQEIDREKLYYYYDCNSLFQYCLKHLKLSEAQASSLIRIARKSEQIPELKEKVKSGEIATTKASKICSVLKPEKPDHNHLHSKPKDLSLEESLQNKEYNQNWLKKAATLSSRELEKEIIKERPQEMSNKETSRQLSVDQHSINLKLTGEEMALLERLKEVTKKDSFKEALKIATSNYLEKKDPLKKKVRKVAQKITCPGTGKKRGRILEATKVALHRKHESKCSHCRSTKNLELHHIKPVSIGGTNDLENLELLCSSCHRQHHFWDKGFQKSINFNFYKSSP